MCQTGKRLKCIYAFQMHFPASHAAARAKHTRRAGERARASASLQNPKQLKYCNFEVLLLPPDLLAMPPHTHTHTTPSTRTWLMFPRASVQSDRILFSDSAIATKPVNGPAEAYQPHMQPLGIMVAETGFVIVVVVDGDDGGGGDCAGVPSATALAKVSVA